jgi:hypothetical protein
LAETIESHEQVAAVYVDTLDAMRRVENERDSARPEVASLKAKIVEAEANLRSLDGSWKAAVSSCDEWADRCQRALDVVNASGALCRVSAILSGRIKYSTGDGWWYCAECGAEDIGSGLCPHCAALAPAPADEKGESNG